MKVEIINNTQKKMPTQFIKDWVKASCKEITKKKISITSKKLVIAFVQKKEIQELNFKYRKKNKPTDILSFESIEENVLGELVIAPEIIEIQAQNHDLTFKEELGYMILHGILHLLGFDHEKTKKEAQIMFKIQESVFQKLLNKKA